MYNRFMLSKLPFPICHFCIFYYWHLAVITDISSRSSNSPESWLGNSHLSLGPGGALSENFQDIDAEYAEDAEEEFFEAEPLPVLGRCTALYTFQGENG